MEGSKDTHRCRRPCHQFDREDGASVAVVKSNTRYAILCVVGSESAKHRTVGYKASINHAKGGGGGGRGGVEAVHPTLGCLICHAYGG